MEKFSLTTAPCFFHPNDALTHASAIQALQAGYVLLIARCAFSSEAETREHYPPTPGDEAAWLENAKPWYKKRRHIFLACIHPTNGQLITSSAEPDKTQTPWTLGFCSEDMPLTQLDMSICQSPDMWEAYNTGAVALALENYTPNSISNAIQALRQNKNACVYSIDPNAGYDCQTATRDVLSLANHTIDPKTQVLPEHTDVLAYYSHQVLSDVLPDAYTMPV